MQQFKSTYQYVMRSSKMSRNNNIIRFLLYFKAYNENEKWVLIFSSSDSFCLIASHMKAGEKLTDCLGIEPATFQISDQHSSNWAHDPVKEEWWLYNTSHFTLMNWIKLSCIEKMPTFFFLWEYFSNEMVLKY